MLYYILIYKAILIFLNNRKRFQYKFKLTEIYIIFFYFSNIY